MIVMDIITVQLEKTASEFGNSDVFTVEAFSTSQVTRKVIVEASQTADSQQHWKSLSQL